MKQIVISHLVCLFVIGCEQQETQSSPMPLQPEAQAIFTRLNKQCAADPWRSEVDMIERPKTRPENYKISGEVNGFVSDSKERLAKHGVQVKWNAQKKLYEVEK